ncbi:MAG TPA: PP0621 family protein, partial [Pusillimonas sp.]
MGKVLSWVILIIVGLIIARVIARQSAQSRMAASRPKQAPRSKAPPVQHSEPMVRCAHCGIHLPRSEA